MNDIWSIIGLSSLVASVVTVLVGIVKDIVVERYRFKRQSEAGYIQKQIEVYSEIHFLLKRIETHAITPRLLGHISENIEEVNKLIRANTSLVEPEILNNWLVYMACLQRGERDKPKGKERDNLLKKISDLREQVNLMVKEIMNNNLIPKYRKIVGETVPDLD